MRERSGCAGLTGLGREQQAALEEADTFAGETNALPMAALST